MYKYLTDTQEMIWNELSTLSGEDVLLLLTDYHGMALLDEGFKEFLVDGRGNNCGILIKNKEGIWTQERCV